MSQFLSTIILILVVSSVTPQTSDRRKQSAAWTPRLENSPAREIKTKHRSLKTPPESLAALRRFLTFVFKPQPNLMKDTTAQHQLLSNHIREAIANLWKTYAKFEKENPGVDCSPNNDSFVGAWDYPTTYSIIGARRYDNRVIIDVTYHWGPDTQYPGTKRLVSYVLIFEDKAWKLDDIYTFSGEYIEANSLTESLWRLDYEC